METRTISFILPVGYEDENGRIHREGTMRPATALDEIEIHGDERNSFHRHYHDILLLARVITSLGDVPQITVEVIEELYEVDFRYLQTFYQSINGDLKSELITNCPKCKSVNKVNIGDVFKNIDFYTKKANKDSE